MKFTKQQIADYVTGWLSFGHDAYDVVAIQAMLHNARHMLLDNQDGIEAYVNRQKYYWWCKRCESKVDIINKKCNCTESPSPWEFKKD